jgi:predicted ATPase/class 3 adenylate cyclase
MLALPTGTVTFLLTDVEGSTRLWEQHPDAMGAALVQHDAIVEFLTEQHHGQVVRPRGEGDSRFCVFARATDAVAAAAAIQRALHDEVWPTPTPIRVRMALHTGEADLRDGDYYGSAINRCARLRAIAHGGQTLLSQAVADLVADGLPREAALSSLGEMRLKDLQRAEPVYQLCLAGLPDHFPALRSLDAVPNNLPPQLTAFVGRQQALADVAALLARTRLVTLTGTGGAGKTRLALQAAADLVERYPDGAWFVDLAPLADAGLLAQAVLAALGRREVPGRPPLDVLLEDLRSRTALVVLDNCEHLIDACARLAEALLRACPSVRVLATSRELLGVAGEAAWRVPSLSAPAEGPGAADPAASEAVQLFVDRARLLQPGFTLGPANAAAVSEVCRRLDGIPLAIELAAARTRVLSPREIAERLDDRFRLLTGGSRTALRRQQTLQAAVDWSHDLLTEPERTLLRRLAVFAGGWTLAAAEAVGGAAPLAPDAVLELLGALVDKSLVVADADADGTRYRSLETIRQYAAGRLVEAGEAAATRARHRDWYLALAERAAPALTGRDQVAWFRRLTVEHDNLRAALEWCRADPSGASAGLRLVAALGWFWRVCGHGAEARGRLAEALARADRAPTVARATALTWAALLEATSANLARAEALGAEAVAAARVAGDPGLLAIALRHLGITAGLDGDAARAGALFGEALAAARAAGDDREAASALYSIASYATRGEDAAAALLAESVALARKAGDATVLGPVVGALGWLALDRDLDEAAALFAEARSICESVDYTAYFVMTSIGLGVIAQRRGDLAAAGAIYRRAQSIQRRHTGAVGAPQLALAWLEVERGRPRRAARLLGAVVNAGPSFLGMEAHRLLTWTRAAVEAALDRSTLERELAVGRAMTLEQTVAYALSDEAE